jgi:hypothetical protein
VRIAKSSKEQDGYEAPGTTGARLKSQDPEGVPAAAMATTKEFRTPEKVSRPSRNFFRKQSSQGANWREQLVEATNRSTMNLKRWAINIC